MEPLADSAAPVNKPVAPDGMDRAALASALTTAAHALAAAAQALLGVPGPAQWTSEANSHFSEQKFSLPGQSQQRIDRLTVREVVNEFLLTKAKGNRSDRYLRQLRVSLASFAKNRANTPLENVTLKEIEKWVFKVGRPKTMRGYLGDVKTLYNFALRRQYISNAFATQVELPQSDTRHVQPGIHTPEQTRTVLKYARKLDLDVCRHLAVRYFAGLRTAEAHRLREENILADRGVIEVPALASKTRSRRLVKIQPCLASWLALGGVLRPLGPMTVRHVLKGSGVDWPHNVTRHSFVSYHLAAYENAAKTALEAGHDQAMLFAHYRALVTKEQAEEFFAIVPDDFSSPEFQF